MSWAARCMRYARWDRSLIILCFPFPSGFSSRPRPALPCPNSVHGRIIPGGSYAATDSSSFIS